MNEVFTTRTKELRTKMGLTQKELATRAHVAVASYSSYEKGMKTPPLDSALRIADALAVSLDWLCGRETARKDFQLLSFADVIRLLFELDKTGLQISVAIDLVDESTETTITEAGLEKLIRNDGECDPMVEAGDLRIYDLKLVRFFEKWASVRTQFIKNVIDDELYQLWCEKQIKEAEQHPLPYTEAYIRAQKDAVLPF